MHPKKCNCLAPFFHQKGEHVEGQDTYPGAQPSHSEAEGVQIMRIDTI
jgi:hypothetical protein